MVTGSWKHGPKSETVNTGGWPATTIESDIISRDAAGRVVYVDDVLGDQWMGYHGLGMMVQSTTMRDAETLVKYSQENNNFDALGNTVSMTRSGKPDGTAIAPVESGADFSYTANGTGRLGLRNGDGIDGRTIHYSYDASGNRLYETTLEVQGLLTLQAFAMKYYAADGRLAVVYKQSCTFLLQATWTCNAGPLPGRGDLATFEEHRYDALGRRILTRNRSWISFVGPNCDDVIQRTVWDGDQNLAEHHATD